MLTVAFPALLALRVSITGGRGGFGWGSTPASLEACPDPETVSHFVEVFHAAPGLPPARLLWRCRAAPDAPAVAVFEAALPAEGGGHAFYRALAVGHSIVGGDFLLADRRAGKAAKTAPNGRGPRSSDDARAASDESVYSTFYLQLAGLGLLEAATDVYKALGLAQSSKPLVPDATKVSEPESESNSECSRSTFSPPSALARYSPASAHASRVLAIGLGAGSSVSALAALGLPSDCLELHAPVLRATRAFFPTGYPTGTCLSGDARETLDSLGSEAYDLVVHDVCAGGLVPEALVRAPFLARVGAALRRGGVLALNHFGAADEAADVADAVVEAGFSDPWVLEDDAPGDDDARNRVLLAIWLGPRSTDEEQKRTLADRASAEHGRPGAEPSRQALGRAAEGLAAHRNGLLVAALRGLSSRLTAAGAPGGAARALRTAAARLDAGQAGVGALADANASRNRNSPAAAKLRAAVEHWNGMRFQVPDAIWNDA